MRSFREFFERHWGRNPYEETPEWLGFNPYPNPDAPKVEGYEGMQVRYTPGKSRLRGRGFNSVADIYDWAWSMNLLEDLRERFYAVYLDQKNRPLGYRLIGAGSVNECLVHPALIFGPAIALQATALVMIHNHPSGELEISDVDRNLTQRMQEIGKLMGIRILDHVVVGASGARGIVSGTTHRPQG